MGLIERIQEKGAGKVISDKTKSTIKKLIKEKRLVYLAEDKVTYTNKQGVKRDITIDEMAGVLFNAGGEDNYIRVGITLDVIKNMLVEAKK